MNFTAYKKRTAMGVFIDRRNVKKQPMQVFKTVLAAFL